MTANVAATIRAREAGDEPALVRLTAEVNRQSLAVAHRSVALTSS